uniref:Endonuclease/exonuclease/phosphatase domain-containing protein n=1 Tax=Ditylum brightwellii TaxID=49249 RepID=A0A6U3SG91_9STRA|mmetsp:Transcript_17533/g.23186  ORF Transcript_17533/g.23186 Transcript_17533/m.23186 type:complete len:305 (+) Transcript_17533:175-1089(+)
MASNGETNGKTDLLPFRAMTWNVLASAHTKWNTAHGGERMAEESECQRNNRHTIVANTINREMPDVVMLQEVDVRFLPSDWEGGPLPCGVELRGYKAYRSYALTRSGVMEGVAILLRRGVWELDTSLPQEAWCRRLGKCQRRGRKAGIVLHARRCHDHSQRCAFASVHLKWGELEPKLAMIADVLDEAQIAQKEISESGERLTIVLGGDFNTRGSYMKPIDDLIEERGLSRCPTPNLPTCMGSQEEQIDFIYCSKNLGCPAGSLCRIGNLPKPGKGPWGDEPGDGSDHAWVQATITSKCSNFPD